MIEKMYIEREITNNASRTTSTLYIYTINIHFTFTQVERRKKNFSDIYSKIDINTLLNYKL